MNNPGLFQARWNLPRLVLCNFVPLALLAFWLWPTGQMLCVLFDEWLFRRLNAPLASHPIWLHVWAITSLRPFEAVVGGILLTVWALGWGYYSPFAYHASEFFLTVMAPLFGRLGKLPGVSRMSVVRSA